MEKRNASHPDIVLCPEQAVKAISLCKENAISYMDDAMHLWLKDRLTHIPIFIEFAMEEIGKAKIILSKLGTVTRTNTITITASDGVYSHERKLKAFADMLALSREEWLRVGIHLDDQLSITLDKNARALLENDARQAIEQARKGHQIRVESAFVDFDPKTNEPKIGHNLDKDALKERVDWIREVIHMIFKDF